MESKEKHILLPLDFTGVSPVAAEHAYHVAQKVGAVLHLRHWVKNEKDLSSAEEKMASIVAKVKGIEGAEVSINSMVAKGNFMKEIASEAEKVNAMLIVIGTHGLQGVEHVVGTHAIRIIGSTMVPFLVVQEKAIGPLGYENIIVPMELQSESKQKLDLVARMAELFNSEIHLLIPKEKDEFLQNALDRNLNYAKTYMQNKGIACTTTLSQERGSEMDKAVFEVMEEKNGDLIAITNWHENKVLGVIGTDDTQDIIINKAMTPVLVINPKTISDFDLFGTTA